MNLKEQDIIDIIESYRNKWRLSQLQMAKLCGMSSSSVYNNWIHNKTKGRIDYLVSFINNTNVSFGNKNSILIEENKLPDYNRIEEPTSPFTKPKKCTNPECIEELNLLKDENIELHRDLRKLTKEKIAWMERQEGAPEPEKKVMGDVEKPQQTGT